LLYLRTLIALAALSSLVASGAAADTKKTKSSSSEKRPSHGASSAATHKKSKGTTTATKGKSSKGHRAAATQSAAATRQSAPSQERYREIQQALAERGYYNGAVDGVWNNSSVEALRRFQVDQNLEPDGKLGALSLIALGLGPKRTPLQMTSVPGNGTLQQPQQQPYLSKPETTSAPTN